jgi:multiple sugar transport system ATP-binding protein
MARIRIEDVHKTYPNGYVAAKGIDIDISDGEFMVLVGASGCGKSTTLRMVAGLEIPTRGKIWIGERDVTQLRVQERDVAMVFQSYALYPNKTVRQNLAFALELRKASREEIDRRIQEVSRVLALDTLLDRKPGQLSGGQRQRVALGRAIVREPQAFLFDEPLSNLDAKLRVQTRAELARLHRRLGATMVYVTHDQEEAMTLGDRIAVLHEGRLQQCAPPLEVYQRPVNAFVAGFVGNPAMNFLACDLRRDGTKLQVEGESFRFAIDSTASLEAGKESRRAQLGIRPQDLEVVATDQADLVARVDVIEPLGAEVLAHLELGKNGGDAAIARDLDEDAGSADHRGGAASDAHDFRLVTAPEVELSEGASIGLRLRRDRLHLFESDTGARLN